MRRQTQADDVERALAALGGYATLADLYKRIPTQNWGTKTPFATVRRILQMDPRFFRIRPGLWGLTAQRDRILDSLQIGAAASEEQQTAFDHTYYQGLGADDWQAARVRGFRAETRSGQAVSGQSRWARRSRCSSFRASPTMRSASAPRRSM
jgi:hypothetical protein